MPPVWAATLPAVFAALLPAPLPVATVDAPPTVVVSPTSLMSTSQAFVPKNVTSAVAKNLQVLML